MLAVMATFKLLTVATRSPGNHGERLKDLARGSACRVSISTACLSRSGHGRREGKSKDRRGWHRILVAVQRARACRNRGPQGMNEVDAILELKTTSGSQTLSRQATWVHCSCLAFALPVRKLKGGSFLSWWYFFAVHGRACQLCISVLMEARAICCHRWLLLPLLGILRRTWRVLF